jgi:hypothetical protein
VSAAAPRGRILNPPFFHCLREVLRQYQALVIGAYGKDYGIKYDRLKLPAHHIDAVPRAPPFPLPAPRTSLRTLTVWRTLPQLGALSRDEMRESLQRIQNWLAPFSREHLAIIWETLFQLVGTPHRPSHSKCLTRVGVATGIFEAEKSGLKASLEKGVKEDIPRPSLGDDGIPSSSLVEAEAEDTFEFCEPRPPHPATQGLGCA